MNDRIQSGSKLTGSVAHAPAEQKENATLASDISALLQKTGSAFQATPDNKRVLEFAKKCQALVDAPPIAAAFVDELAALLQHKVHASGAAIAPLVRDSFAQNIELLQGKTPATEYFWLLNELRAVQSKALVSQLVFALPFEYSAAKNDGLVSIVPSAAQSFDADEFYRTFHNGLNSILKGAGGRSALDILAGLCRQSIDAESHEYAAVFWLTCGCYVGSIELTESLSAAHQVVMQQIELVIRQHVVNADSQILPPEGIELVETALCNMLTYIACAAPADPVFEQLESKFRMLKSLRQLDDLSQVSPDGIMLGAGVQTLRRRVARLKLDVDALPDTSTDGVAHAMQATEEIRDACTLLCTRSEMSLFESAISGLKNYQGRDGTIRDLETCAAALIRVDQLLAERFISLSGELTVEASDDARLNALLIDELLAMLEPICEADAPDADQREWITVALGDVISASSFVSDAFLAEQLPSLVKYLKSESTELSQLTGLASILQNYLIATKADRDASDAKEKLLAIVLSTSVASDKRDRRVNIAELASDNSDLLHDVEPQASKATATAKETASDNSSETATLEPVPGVSSSLEFGDQCNRYVDTIQLALDTALGSSGNLAPDKTVTAALDNLYKVVRSAEHDPLLTLIEPLSQVLVSAERAGSTLSQSDTLLVQEAIVAITIGLDAVVNKQPMPDLVADVAQRITQVAVDDSHKARGGFEAAGLIDVFVEEAEDLGQRLFELFQRWRGAPQGGTRIQTDIRRLLHTLKGSADTVGLGHIAAVAHALESFLVSRSNHQVVPSVEFFDTSVEAIEVILDDVDRVRNGESVVARDEILLLLESQKEASANTEVIAANEPVASVEAASENRSAAAEIMDFTAEKTPAFGSAKYFSELERAQQRLSRQHWESHELHEKLRGQLAEMQSSLQSARHLLSKIPSDPANDLVGRSISESFSDLHELQSELQRTLERIAAIEERQLSDVVDLESLVISTDRISVESVRLRMESLVQRVAAAQNTVVRFEFTGADLELDRKLFAEVNGPLEQLLINAVVHGSQSNTIRLQQGKAEELLIRVAFAVRNGALLITVADDGAGIDINKLRDQLLKRNPDQSPDDAAVLGKIVEQGITTSVVANRSAGRGVGLDVVKEWVYRRHGSFSVETEPGVSTVFSVSIPLQAESAVVMVVQQGGQYFAIDIAQVAEIKDATTDGLSLAAVLGATNNNTGAVLCCRTQNGTVDLEVETIVGRKTIRFNNNDHVLNSNDLYRSAGLMDNRHIVLRLNTECFVRYATSQQVEAQPETADASVLIVDDSVTIRASFGRAMQTAGYNIVLARNGLEAMEYLEKHQPEVIILDLEMPLMDGYELGAFIRKEPRLSRSALVVVSSKPKAVVGDWLSAVNADAYFEKPCSEAVIAGAVAGLV